MHKFAGLSRGQWTRLSYILTGVWVLGVLIWANADVRPRLEFDSYRGIPGGWIVLLGGIGLIQTICRSIPWILDDEAAQRRKDEDDAMRKDMENAFRNKE